MPTPEEEFLNSPPTPLPEGTVEAPPEPEAVEPEQQEAAAEGEPAKAESEAEPKPETDDEKQPNWAHRRIDELTRLRHDERRRAEAEMQRANTLQAELDKLRRGSSSDEGQDQAQPKYTQADLDRLSDERAAQRDAQREAERAQDTFNRSCNDIHAEGLKSFSDFRDSLENLHRAGGITPSLIKMAMATGSAASVLYELGKDPAEAERVITLPFEEMAVAVAKLAAKPASTSAAPPLVSKAPAPIRPIANGGGKPGPKSIEDMSMAEFAEYEANRAAKRSA